MSSPRTRKQIDSIKNVVDLSEKHFSRFGEFLVSFELSKNGWNVYNPVYDEYIDIIIHKYICDKCGKLWSHTPLLICKNCGKDFSKSLKKDFLAIKVCNDCGFNMKGNKIKCPKCKSTNLYNKPSCDKCKGEVQMKHHRCECGSTSYLTKFRTIQVKSSRIEKDNDTGRSKNTYAIDIKPKDLIEDDLHFFIWCLVDDKNKPNFLVMSVKDFKETMGQSLRGISFFKDQDRQHFSAKDFGKWKKFLNRFDKLDN